MLPIAIRSGDFERPPSVGSWLLADPGGRWNSSDVIVDATAALPMRRLIVGACDSSLCVIHYEQGGRGWSTHILAIARSDGRWRAVWHAAGFTRVDDIAELRALLRNQVESSFDDRGVSLL